MRGVRGALIAVAIGAPVALVLACSDDEKGAAIDPTACGELASRCHPYAKVSTLGHECHELGHAGNDSACTPRKAECLAACPEVEGGASHPDASAEVSDGAAPDGPQADDAGAVCVPYCQCLTDTCATQSGYPFTGLDDCVAKCPSRSAEEKACLPKFCEQAKGLANKTHACEHAWGKFGLDECETL